MVLVNLIQRERRKEADRSWPIALGLLGLILAGIFLTVPMDRNTKHGLLGTEEKEIVIDAISRVEDNTPEMEKWSRFLRVAVENGMVTIPESFFSSDPIAQESEIVQIMAKQILPRVSPPEIAVVGE